MVEAQRIGGSGWEVAEIFELGFEIVEFSFNDDPFAFEVFYEWDLVEEGR